MTTNSPSAPRFTRTGDFSWLSRLARLPWQGRPKLPQESGVYFFLNDQNKLLYIGKAKNLKNRVASHAKNPLLASRVVAIRFLPTVCETDALLLEANLIRQLQPKFNRDLRNGKNYPLVKITKEIWPRVLIVYQEISDGSRYFGPYPGASGQLRHTLKFLRRYFPFVTNIHQSQRCLLADLGLCPCKDPRSNYLRNLRLLVAILRGERPVLQKKLTRQMTRLAVTQKFEEATKIREQITALTAMTTPHFLPWAYKTNPDLAKHARETKVARLRELFPTLPETGPLRIEGYDVSHFAGQEVVGSLVTFTSGEKDPKGYRRFRLKIEKNDDFAAISEIVSRRLSHFEWPKPDLMLIDGGKGQLQAALTVFTQNSVLPPVIVSLAKKEEIIHGSDQEIKLRRNDPGLQLLQEVRDEAHRFARHYHLILRKKSVLQ